MALTKGSTGYLSTGYDVVPIVPNDDNDLPEHARAIRCKPTSGAGGTLRFTSLTGQVRNTEIVAGELLLVAAKRIHETGTTATGLEAIV
tara:strand:- start:2157 stop:2423 length:267 start_codon:yes stop_codon:yes gene_type:complete